ncbi:4-alpha-glucanotransferase [Bacteroidales bacterium OttesenSCG-928-J19]|nr:4-alpha-glucanotransferase [Bacteroidales bacterium OttesenSCG-928-J19]
MLITFNLPFHTIWGQELYVFGSLPELGNWDYSRAVKMNFTGEGNWQVELSLPEDTDAFEYRYFVRYKGDILFEEWKRNHSFVRTGSNDMFLLLDHWQNMPKDMVYYSSAFSRGWFRHEPQVQCESGNLRLKLWAPYVRTGERLAFYSNQDDWAVPRYLTPTSFPQWELYLDKEQVSSPLEFKFCKITEDGRAEWEEGENRSLSLPAIASDIVVSGLVLKNQRPEWQGVGLSIPVFSLYSKESFGIGDFADLKKLVDWADATGQDLIQILPINDTTMSHTWEDSYPYNAISIYALHPLYLSLDKLGELDPEQQAFFRGKQQGLNALGRVDYEKVDTYKWQFFRLIYQQDGAKTLRSEGFRSFFSDNESWLVPYAAFSFLREQYHTPDFTAWGEQACYMPERIQRLCEKEEEGIGLYYYLQYHLHLQLKAARDYANSKGIVLKGDIPIGISKTSVEAWTQPEYFNMDYQTGAPPDDFSITGQNWGFPTYNWQRMEQDGYRWWKDRFQHLANYFDAYRIDHILGFFRIWEIPNESVQGLLGHFSPALPFSIEEIRAAGMHFRKEQYTRPRIREIYLREMLGEQAGEVMQTYLDRVDADYFVLKAHYDTQRKLEVLTDNKLKETLYSLCNEVLFLPDKTDPNRFHPRISAYSSRVYQDLSQQDRYAFDFLYWEYYYNRHNEFWKQKALKHLSPLVDSTGMLPCGEDLGMIPASVPEVMNKLQILSLEIERMPKAPDTEFTHLDELPYLSVCTTSTHDMSTLRGWWVEDRERTQRYYSQVLHGVGEAPADCLPSLCEQILTRHLQSPALLCVVPFQDWLSIDEELRNPDVEGERINIPANPRHYWRYRMHLTIEELLAEEDLNRKIRQLTSLRKSH